MAHKGPKPLSKAWPEGKTLTPYKFRIGFHTTLADINTRMFFFFCYPYTDYQLQNEPDDKAGPKYPTEDRQRTYNLASEGRSRVGERHQQ
jgi:hypothetical protein